jgi:hypothetical protein
MKGIHGRGPRSWSQPHLSVLTCTGKDPKAFAERILPSVLNQSATDFEWVIVNEGGDLAIRRSVEALDDALGISYVEMPKPRQGTGLAFARNLGLLEARGAFVLYADESAVLGLESVGTVISFLESQPSLRMGKLSARPVVGSVLGGGKSTGAVKIAECALDSRALLGESGLGFEASGFFHVRAESPRWNPDFLPLLGTEFLLRAAERWGANSFPQVVAPEAWLELSERLGPSEELLLRERERLWQARGRYPLLLSDPGIGERFRINSRSEDPTLG